MITNHGIHDWEVVPGLTDTGGQNVFVNQFAQALVNAGYKVTIANRGGYSHPVTGDPRQGVCYRDRHQRLLYLEDGHPEFVRKEDMAEFIPKLTQWLIEFVGMEGSQVDLIISHYWDAAQLGVLFSQALPAPPPHVWVPHSLGKVKKRNVPPETWASLWVDERIAIEEGLVSQVDGVAATSAVIREALQEGYRYVGPDLFLPPCVDPERYHPRQVLEDDPLWCILAARTGMPPERVQACKLVTEVSRTDQTKRKDVFIRAFARIARDFPEALLVVTIEEAAPPLAADLYALIQELNIQSQVAILGSIWDLLPSLYAATSIYCTPSVMEGFGMAAQEAAASGVPVVASDLVPFATEYLLGERFKTVQIPASETHMQVGEGTIVVAADDVAGFAFALQTLLFDEFHRQMMGVKANRITIPYFTWEARVAYFLKSVKRGLGT